VQPYLNPLFVTGFCDGESSFTLSIYKDNERKIGWGVIARFSIELHSRDLELLKQIKDYFGCGVIYLAHNNQAAIFSVSSIKDVTTSIIPH